MLLVSVYYISFDNVDDSVCRKGGMGGQVETTHCKAR